MIDKTELTILPRRQPGKPINLDKNSSKKIISNYYPVELNGSKTAYQYTFDCQPSIPQDSTQLLHLVIRYLKKQLKNKIQIISFNGNIIWGSLKQNLAFTLISQFEYDKTTYKFSVTFKLTKEIPYHELLKNKQMEKFLFQMVNSTIKNQLKDKNYQELTRGKFFDEKEIQVKQIGLSVLQGYKFTLANLKKQLYLQVDVCTRVFRSSNLLEQFQRQYSTRQARQQLIGATVLTRYGKRKTYKIIQIDDTLNPKSEFYYDIQKSTTTYADYYKSKYGLPLTTVKQPLIKVQLRIQKFINKMGVIEKKPVYGYLIPQFLSLTGMSDEQRGNFQTMKGISQYTKKTPNQRVDLQGIIVDKLNQQVDKKFKIGKIMQMDAYYLQQPRVQLQSQKFKSVDGTLNFKDKLKNPLRFNNWIVVYSHGKNPKNDDGDADEVVSLFNQASNAFGIKFDEPGFVTCNNNINDWKSQIADDIKKNGKPQIIVLLFTRNQEKYYGQLKRFISCQLQIPCQVVRKQTLINTKKSPLSSASKIIIQMNQKAGGVAWQVIRQSGYLSKKKVMCGSFSISKGKKGFTLAFVGTINPEMTKVWSFSKVNYKNKQSIPISDFQSIFKNWARNYVQINKTGPESIIIFRQGLSVEQIKAQVKNEYTALKAVVNIIRDKINVPNYNPQILYTVVNKKINTRIFDIDNRAGSGKFGPKVSNPASGTVVFDQLSVDSLYDFHLAAQKVTQGTCTPTHYIIAYDQSKIPQQSLAQFVYEQCFNYYNWTGAVKVPAVMQCSDKLAKLVGESIQADVIKGDVLTSYFFL